MPMTDGELQELTDFALSLSYAAGREILPYFRRNTPIDAKGGAEWDPVTEGDRAGERAIRTLIEKRYPAHGILGEEYGEKAGSSSLRWILDPVDGTRAFVIGLPVWANLIALYDGDVPLLGVMSQPFVGDTFFGNRLGAWHEHGGKREVIRVSGRTSLIEAQAGTTTPHRIADRDRVAFERLRTGVRNMRYGGDAYFFSLLAAGHLDLAMDPDLQIYDIAALIPIIEGAGGVVGSWTDNDPRIGGNVLAAASPELLAAAQRVMQV
jgi:histidinol phosphatase-like enzyme (inositol monophosphatase family)